MILSDLQLTLLLIGALVIIAVVAFNRYQQKRFERARAIPAAETAMAAPRRMPIPEQRLDPTFDLPADAVAESGAAPQNAAPPVQTRVTAPRAQAESSENEPPWPTSIDHTLDYVASIQPVEPVSGRAFFAAPHRSDVITKPMNWLGLNVETNRWERLRNLADVKYARLIAVLQLVNRSGPASGAEIGAFCDLVQELAQQLLAVVDCPDRQAAHARAVELDRFCAEVDVEIAIHALSADERGFPAAKLVSVAENSGMRIAADGALEKLDAHGATEFRLRNENGQPFIAGALDALNTQGVLLELDVPRASGALESFDRMVALAQRITDTLGGQLVDDNRQLLSEQAIGAIRAQLQQLYANMHAQHIKPGSELALRLFS